MKTNCNPIQVRLMLAVLLMLPAAGLAQQFFQFYTPLGYYDYTTNNGVAAIYDYRGSDSTLAIPGSFSGVPVTSIGSSAFYQSAYLTGVVIGTNVNTIGQNAFFQCTALASVTIPGSVTNIGQGPFVDCQALTTISVSASNLFYVSTNQVLFNKSLTSLIQYPCGLGGSYTISAAVTNVGEAFIGSTLSAIVVNSTNLYYSSTNNVLFDKNKATLLAYPGGLAGNYAVPSSVTTIESASFEYDAGVTGVTIGTNVTSIGDYAFYDCASMTNISVSSTNFYFSSINGVLFDKKQWSLIQYPCGVSGGYTIPGTVTNIVTGAFGDANGLTGVVIPNSVISIGFEAFYTCQNLFSVSLGNHVANIAEEAFFDCPKLAEIAIPDSVTNIDLYAFYYCTAMNSATFGTGIISIGQEAFAYCSSLTNACFSGKEPIDGGYIFYGTSLSAISYVTGASGWGASYDGYATAPCAECSGGVPALAITASGTNVILSWLGGGFTLQSTTNLAAPVWVTVTGQNSVTNAATGAKKFYRLSQ